MASELTSVVLEFSEDDLSDTTPAWQDVTNPYLRNIEWWSGVDNEGDEPQPGGAVIVLKNINRDWEPDYTGGRFSPNIVYGRRFRLTLNDGTGATQEGLWYITDIQPDYIADTDFSLVTITCADGFEVLALDDIESLDPPDAEEYADVVGFDRPWGYWRLGETTRETQAVSITKTVIRGKGKKRRKLKRKVDVPVTVLSSEGVAGPAGVYKTTTLLDREQDGAILGDQDASILVRSSGSSCGHVVVTYDDTDIFTASDSFSIEMWTKVRNTGDVRAIITGPHVAGGGDDDSIWVFIANLASGGTLSFFLLTNAATNTGVTVTATGLGFDENDWIHAVGTYDNRAIKLYFNGAEVATGTLTSPLYNVTDPTIRIGRLSETPLNSDAYYDEVALYETVLSPSRILAHYTAGTARGWPEQTAGTRIADIATHALWSEASIQTTGRTVQPQMKHGQARLGEISELMQAEGPQTLFFFNGSGDPVYLGYEWKALSSAYNVVQATFGDEPGDIAIDGIEPIYDNETFNVVEASREGGELVSVGAGGTPRRVNPDFTDLLLSDDDDVETIANHVLDLYEAPAMRPKTVSVNGVKAVRQILDLRIGYLIRVRRAGIDRVTHILGYRKSLDPNKHLTCQYALARGYNADDGFWHVGISGWSEIGQTTKVA